MPIYEYVCKKCGHVTEALRSILQRDNCSDLKCDKCGSHQLSRKLSTFSTGASEKITDSCPTGTCSLTRNR